MRDLQEYVGTKEERVARVSHGSLWEVAKKVSKNAKDVRVQPTSGANYAKAVAGKANFCVKVYWTEGTGKNVKEMTFPTTGNIICSAEVTKMVVTNEVAFIDLMSFPVCDHTVGEGYKNEGVTYFQLQLPNVEDVSTDDMSVTADDVKGRKVFVRQPINLASLLARI